MRELFLGVWALTAAFAITFSEAQAQVVSHVEGHITVNPEIDPTTDYSGFEVIVGTIGEGGLDTLGHGITDRSGHFRMDVEVPERGVYPLYVTRRARLVATADLAVAQGDTAVVTAELPLAGRLMRIRSTENAAWMAYRNTLAQYNESVMTVIQEAEEDINEALRNSVMSTASIFYSVQDNYPGTFGGELALAESITMLDGWADEILLSRAEGYGPERARFLDVARAARRAATRVHGQEAGLQLLDGYISRTTDPEVLAALKAERVQAFIDVRDTDRALAAASDLMAEYPESPWSEWARRSEYEIATLFPGNPALDFSAERLDGTAVSLEDFRGEYIVLEFWAPRSEAFQRQLAQRQALIEQFQDDPVQVVSLSVDPSRENIETFREGRAIDGHILVDPLGAEGEAVSLYNVTHLPTRVIIDPEFNIAGKYVGDTLSSLAEDLAILLAEGRQ